MANSENTIILAGRVVGFTPPTQGQIESMIRIAKTIQSGPDDAPSDFWVTQMYRVGKLIDNLIAEADREIVDDLYLEGKISALEALQKIMEKVSSNAVASEERAIAKANKTRVRRD